MEIRPGKEELAARAARLHARLDERAPAWSIVVIAGRINMYYFTGTMQDGIFVLSRSGGDTLWVRRSFERAREESPLPDIRPMESYREAAAAYPEAKGFPVHVETEKLPLGYYARLNKHFGFSSAEPADGHISAVRAVKSEYELYWMRRAGELHQKAMKTIVPSLLREGMSELDLAGELYLAMLREGYDGVCRFARFDTEVFPGQIAFGESSLYPVSFDGPGGSFGQSPAVPLIGSRHRRLRRGDLVFVDTGCGINGYNTDKTQLYCFGTEPEVDLSAAHARCAEIQRAAADMLRPGVRPSDIYKRIMASLDEDFLENFMGFGKRRVKFLGHSIGLTIDETPVIAEGFDEPLEEGMAIALEPKKGIPGRGMVGVEDTYLVSSSGGIAITGPDTTIIRVG